ncbi:MAG: PEGA domain-containing protein [Deltaproteobacteria bacterium]|nr:PEGA domain-containing protein [Deltaproteobacteria bacterium]
MTYPRAIPSVVLTAVLLFGASAASAEEPGSDARKEAKERFARGLHLFENGDNGGALAEFERANQLVPNQLVLYNIALVYAAMGKPVEAVDLLDDVLKNPGTLKPEHLTRARATKEEQDKRIGQLDVKVNVPATIEIDGVRAGNAPMQEPLDVAAGEHVVGALASGYLPLRQAVTVAGQARAELTFELEPTDTKVAHVAIHSPLPGAEVRVDDVLVGKTPFAAPLSVAPGRRVFEIQRPGYMISRRELNLSDGVHTAVGFDPDEDPQPGDARGRLRLAVGGGDVIVTIDGRPRGVYRQPYDLPAGPHTVKLEQAGFESLERLTEVPAGDEVTVKVNLRPTVETRAAYVSHARSVRSWAYVALVSGAVIAGVSTGVALWSNGKLPAAESKLADVERDAKLGGGGSCDMSGEWNPDKELTCRMRMDDAVGDVNFYKNWRLGGIIGAAAGAAVLGTGIVLLVTGPDPGLYDREETLAGSLMPVFVAAPGGGSLLLRGRF